MTDMERRRFTFVTPWYGQFAGGAEVAVRSCAEELARRGFPVRVLTTCCRSPFESWWTDTLPVGVETVNGVVVHRFPVDTAGEDLYHQANGMVIRGGTLSEAMQWQFVANSINSQALAAYAGEQARDDVVIAAPYLYGAVNVAVAALDGAAIVMPCFHDEAQFYWAPTEQLLRNSRRVIFLSEEEKSLAIRHHGPRIGRRLVESPVAGLGVEIPAEIRKRLEDRSALAAVRDRHRLPERYFLYVGRKDAGKNVPLLVHYFLEYREAGGTAALVFLGGGDAGLVPRVDGLHDLGFVPEADKYLILSGAAGLINLSHNESFSIVIMEAWLCGIPVIASAGSEVVAGHCRRSNGGLAVADGAEFRLALQVLEDPSVATALAAAGQRYARRNYSWDVASDRLIYGVYGG